MLQQWVVTATHRQERTYKPPEGFCPLCPTRDMSHPTEVPAPGYEIVVFENKFPSFRRAPHEPAVDGTDIMRVRPARGVCEVVLYTDKHHTTFADLDTSHITNLIEVWTDRYNELGALDYIDYVLIFENKGDAVGVTLHHPHGQIYAFPFIPPIPLKELESSYEYKRATGKCLFCDILFQELEDGRRVVAENLDFVAVVPFYARYPYEIHVISRNHRLSLSDLDGNEKRSLAGILKTVTCGYDHLFGFSFPYMMIMHQAPTRQGDFSHYHFHIEFYPPHRTAKKIKYLAGCESGGGTFINDTLPEETAEELRRAIGRASSPGVMPLNPCATLGKDERGGGASGSR
jgi:UDPglucose--hexose-1-phosphate uridylyltransferase